MANMTANPKISPFLWFNSGAEEAAALYTSIFPNSRVLVTSRYPEGGPWPPNSVMTVTFEIGGLRLTALNGGPQFKLTEGFSLAVHCDSQAEIDEYWSKLTANGGQAQACGWLKDRFGVSWQIVPANLGEMLKSPKAPKVMQALMGMVKLDMAVLAAASR